jgi:hypothetical protein
LLSACGVVFTFDEFGVDTFPALLPAIPVCVVAGVLVPLGTLEGVAVDGLAVVDEAARCRARGVAGALA